MQINRDSGLTGENASGAGIVERGTKKRHSVECRFAKVNCSPA